jgi:NAD(P)-dependent dehydrogenase (short-subunit alcohol dehydrogenase family)
MRTIPAALRGTLAAVFVGASPAQAAGGDRAKWEPIWGSFRPMRRCDDPHEVAAAIAYLASDGDFITGTDLLIDGGPVSMSPDGLANYEVNS